MDRASTNDSSRDSADDLGALVERFRAEQAANRQELVDLTSYLPPADAPLRSRALALLVVVDLERCWRHGVQVLIDRYVERYAELGPLHNLPPELIVDEYRVRHQHGDRPAQAEYKQRFPVQFNRVRMLILESLPTMTASPVTPNLEEPVVPSRPADVLAVEGGYRPLRQLGRGGYGEVWSAEAPGGIEVAVKRILRPLNHDSAQRELQSLETIKGLRHPFLLSTQMYYALEDRLLVVMELADGSLRDRVRECHKNGLTTLPVSELMGYMQESAEGLDFLHERRIVHRDVKPENILLLQRHAKLGDFGMARLIEDNRGGTEGIASGTPMYMAPEVWRGEAVPASDQYALALSYAEIRLNRRVFDGSTATEMMAAHVEQRPNLQGLPEAEQHVLMNALAKDPTRRYRSCREFVRDLSDALLAPPRVEDKGAGPIVLKTAALEREIPPPSRDHLRFGERPIDADRAVRFCGTLLGVLTGIAMWRFLDHLDIGVLRGETFGTLAHRLLPPILATLGGVLGLLMAAAGARLDVLRILTLVGGAGGLLFGSVVRVRWLAADHLVSLQYPSTLTAAGQSSMPILIGGVLGLLGGALLAVASRAFGPLGGRLVAGAFTGVFMAVLLTGRWIGSGIALAVGGGPALWPENSLATPAPYLILGAGRWHVPGGAAAARRASITFSPRPFGGRG